MWKKDTIKTISWEPPSCENASGQSLVSSMETQYIFDGRGVKCYLPKASSKAVHILELLKEYLAKFHQARVFICPLKTVAAFQQQSTYFLSFNMASFTYWKQHLHTTEKDIKSCSCILCYIKILAVGSGNINCSTLKLSRRHLEDFSIRNLICKVSSPIDG